MDVRREALAAPVKSPVARELNDHLSALPEDLAACLTAVAEVREVSARTTSQDRDLYVPRSRAAELVKVAGGPRPKCRSWEVAPSLNLLPNLHRAGLVGQKAPVSFRRCFLLFIYTFLSYLSIFYRYNLFHTLKSLFCGSQN